MFRKIALTGAVAISLLTTAGIASAAPDQGTPGPAGMDRVLFDCATTGVSSMNRQQMLVRSQQWIDAHVMYDQASCYTNSNGSWRQDCSGFVSMAWGLGTSATTDTLPNYSNVIARADLRPGDILLRRDASIQHVALFVRWADAGKTSPVVREEYTTGQPAVERSWSASYANTFTPRRYKNVVESAQANTHDFNGDGRADIVAWDPYSNLTLFPGDGAGHVSWGGAMWPGAGEWTGYKELTAGDFNSDGRTDIVALDPYSNLTFFPGDGAGHVSWGGAMWPGAGEWTGYKELTAGDFNGDGRTDIAAWDPYSNLTLFPGDGAGHVSWGGAMWPGAGEWAGYKELTAGDFNGDGRTDIAAWDPYSNLTLFPGDGAGHVSWGGAMWPGAGEWTGYKTLTAGDYNGDGRTDIAAIDPGSNLILFPGDGAGHVGWGGGMWPGTGEWTGYKAIA
ncbi:VCBS repeat-containing protein [Actinokineospora sp. NBRC 105648]|uniref:C40 family peptidase n=1 Tax=Actinokineospora sp. NBRC 105648 TaxID=3032206 RepID=UPI0024A047C5|nr:VCBS repeat-containing protein [Actinokineospora sp. NBRC 105648]GLZ39204.1 hypothetical protein Acsp05_28280 [Actinokineospora sp. NBRC 105648]